MSRRRSRYRRRRRNPEEDDWGTTAPAEARTPAEEARSAERRRERDRYRSLNQVVIRVLSAWGEKRREPDIDTRHLNSNQLLHWAVVREIKRTWNEWDRPDGIQDRVYNEAKRLLAMR